MNQNGKANGHYQTIPSIDDSLPHSIEAESAVLGGIIIDSDAYYEVSDFLRYGHFYSSINGEIYRAMGNLLAERIPLDLVTLSELLRAREVNANEGMESYLIGLVNTVPTAINTAAYGRIVHSLAIRRNTIHAGYKLRSIANDQTITIDEVIAQSEAAVFGVADGVVDGRMQSIKEGLAELYDLILARHSNGGQIVGIPTGLTDIDRILRGVKPSCLYILAGRPGMGKSMLANEIALGMLQRKRVGLIFNMEMSAREINTRFVANRAGVNMVQVEEGRLDVGEFERVNNAIGELSTLRLFMDDSTGLTPSKLRAKCRRVYAEHGLDFVIIDYLQLMVDDQRHGNREREISEISRQLKRLAKDLQVPIIALAQLSRSLESRADKRPILSDLRESGDIENNADVVMFLYRDEYYTKENCLSPNQAELEIAKHRNGPLGRAWLHFDGATMRFRNLQRQSINL